MMTIKCFKSLCLKARTKKADEIHEYYMNMEEILQKIIEEETDELKLQLENKETIILEIKKNAEETEEELKKEKKIEVEKAIISQFPLNTECIYFGTIDNINESEEKLIKFGSTNNLHQRVLDHKKDYNNFILAAAFRVQNKVEIENLIKSHTKIKKQIRTICSNLKNRTEIIAYDNNFTIDQLKKNIKDIIYTKTYSSENFDKILKKNEELEKENNDFKEKFEEQVNKLKEEYEFKIIVLEEDNKSHKDTLFEQSLEIQEMKELIEKQKETINNIKVEQESSYQNSLLPEDDLTQKFTEFINKMCIVREDVEESSTNMEGQYRIWSKTKPKKEIFHAFKNYLDTRFKPKRLSNQTKNQVVHGYVGVKLKDIEYKKTSLNNDVETFAFQVCKFSPSGKILTSTLLTEYQKWKKSVNKETTEDDIKNIKEYFNCCEYVIKAQIWLDNNSSEGYYGILLKCEEDKHKNTSSTGKKVNKIEIITNQIIGSWETIAKAADYENISAAKMSRSIKAKTIFNNDYYYKVELFTSLSVIQPSKTSY
jgi:hypothetical protein